MLYSGFQLPKFKEEGHPSSFSMDDMNLLVMVNNAWLRCQIIRGSEDKVIITDNNVFIQIRSSVSDFPSSQLITLYSCTTGRTYLVVGKESETESE